MGWRDKYKVHPAADVFPMMSGDELDDLGQDIKANGLKNPITFWHPPGRPELAEMIDGRNRIEAMDRAGCLDAFHDAYVHCGTPEQWVITLNIHRRHMSQADRAAALVKLAKLRDKPDQPDPVCKGGRGKRSPVKAKALEINAALPKEQQVSEPTIKRAIAKADGREPKPKPKPEIDDDPGDTERGSALDVHPLNDLTANAMVWRIMQAQPMQMLNLLVGFAGATRSSAGD